MMFVVTESFPDRSISGGSLPNRDIPVAAYTTRAGAEAYIHRERITGAPGKPPDWAADDDKWQIHEVEGD